MELVGGIHRVDGIRGVNCYVVEGAEGLTLVDTGAPGSGRRILEYIKRLGKREKDLRVILLTHSDVDHVGSAAALKRRTGARIAIHEGDAASLSGTREGKRVKGALGALLRFAMLFIKAEHVQADVLLEDGEKIGSLTVIATPGHTQGHCCFLHETSRTIFVGDALRTTRGGDVRISPDIMNLSTEQAWKSAEILASRDFDALLPGHGEPLLQAAGERVRRLVQSHGT